MTQIYVNNALTTASAQVLSTDTVVTVADISKFPSSIASGNFIACTFANATYTSFEVVLATAINVGTSQLTITRAQEGTTAQTWPVGSNFYAAATAGSLQLFPQLNAAATVSGLWNYTTAPTISGSSIWTAANISPAPINSSTTITGAWQFNSLPNYYDGTNTYQLVTTKGGVTFTNPIVLPGNPTQALQAAPKQYVDSVAAGLTPHQSVVATSIGANVNTASAPATLDGVTLSSGNRILLKDQTTTSQNLVWIFNGTGSALTQATDFTGTVTSAAGTSVFVTGGTTYANSTWAVTTTGSVTWGTTNVSWTQTAGAPPITSGNGINITNATISVVANTSTNNLTVTSSGVDLNAISGLTGNLGATLVSGGSGILYNNFTVDTYGRINSAANAPYALTTGATFTGSLIRTTTPSVSTDVTNVSYVQNYVSSQVLTKPPVAVVATSNISTLSGLQTIDGYTLQVNDRLLLVGQTTASQNGVYTVGPASSYTWSRANDNISFGAFWSVMNGATYGYSTWELTTLGTITVGTTNLNISRINGLGQVTSPANISGGLLIQNNSISLYSTGVTPNIYTAATITVDAYGRITSASSTTSGVSSVFGRSGTVFAEAGDYNFAQIANTPTTLAGYGITDPIMKTNGTTTMTSTYLQTFAANGASLMTWGPSGGTTNANSGLAFSNTAANAYQVVSVGTSGGTVPSTILNFNALTVQINGSPVLTSATYGAWLPATFSGSVSSIQATVNLNYLADTSTNTGTIVLPLNPGQGSTVRIADAGRNFGTNNLTVNGNGANIASSATNLILNQTGMGVTLVYFGTNAAGTVVGWTPFFNY